MIHILKEIRTLREEGKLHNKLIRTVRITFLISVILLAVVIYNSLSRNFTGYYLLVGLTLALIGFILGLNIFNKMSTITWNEEKEVLQSERMDKVGYVVLGLYILFEISLRTFLKSNFTVNVVPLLLCGIFGTIFSVELECFTIFTELIY
jgi:hypothetical protein